MTKIRIVSTPKGAAPYNRRAQLVGAEVPLSEEQKDPERVFNVESTDAISVLRLRSAELAEWWEKYLAGLGVSVLAFSRGVCELIPDPPKRSAAAMTASNRR